MGINAVSNLSKTKHTIKAKSCETISFMGAEPNYYRITNSGATALYLGVSMTPSEDFFDAKIPSASTKVFVDAFGHHEIYIYNPSIEDTNIILTSFSADFDPSVLALSDIGQDFSQIDFSGEVDATGDMKTMLSNINDKMPVISQIHTAINYIKNDVDVINDLKSNSDLTVQDLLNIKTNVLNLVSLMTDTCTKWYKGENTEAENKYTMKYIELLSNDGDSDLFVTISSTGNITLKPGEVLNKIRLDEVRTITIPKNSTYRLIGG